MTYKFLFSVAVGKNFLLTRPPSRILEMSSSDFILLKGDLSWGLWGVHVGNIWGRVLFVLKGFVALVLSIREISKVSSKRFSPCLLGVLQALGMEEE